ncbi:hypothetical protein ACFQ08_02020 [Streptosporangium algeriense]|uniref:Uncharacterized protein n=1 Tax=Streptosporangium algeriense TaxID=1682748 RepID=A0ABW3DIY5_9ACTN
MLSTAFTSGALAATEEPASFADTPGATAPACVARPITWQSGDELGPWTVHVKNNCTSYKRVQVLTTFGSSSCYNLAPGAGFNFSRAALDGYRKTVIC